MSKITNLIGTTWRLGGDIQQLTAEYGVFNVLSNGTYSIVSEGEVVQSFNAISDNFYCGYSYNTKLAVDGMAYISLLGEYDGQTELPICEMLEGSVDFVYEFTITGGTDISNPLFIDFINTYGTLVSGGEPPTAEGVKSKLQSLITASNAKTGKSDANLTDAVNTLLEGYGQGGGGGGECSGNHIIEVDELPEVGEEGKIYGIPAFKDVFLVMGEDRILYSPTVNADGMTVGCTTATSTTMVKIDAQMVFYYRTDIPDIYLSMIGGEAEPMGTMMGGMLFKGEITDTANATEDGYYAYMGRDFYKYTNGVYAPLIEQGSFIFTSNGDGTCTIIGLNPPYAVHIEIPTTSPQGDIVTGLGNSPTYAGLFNKRAIKSVIIPSTITNISAYVFYDCLMLNNIIFKGTVEQWNAITFSSSTSWKTNVPATKVVCSDGEVAL